MKAACKHLGCLSSDYDSRVEMGGHFHGFHYRFSKDIEAA